MTQRRGRGRAIALGSAVVAIAAGALLYRRLAIPDVPRIAQAWASSGVEYADTDSLAALRHADGSVRVLATAKWGNRIDVFDAATGRFIERLGAEGDGPGEFRRPNGIAVARFPVLTTQPDGAAHDEDVIIVVERDGARVQLFAASGNEPLGSFGAGVLNRPYGVAVSMRDGAPLIYVTDTGVAPEKTVSVFRPERTADGMTGTLVRQFGDAGNGRIVKAESVVVDEALGRVLLCDEDRGQRNVKVYDIDGRFTGRTFGDGIIGGDPEGVVIVEAAPRDFVLITDQRSKITIWHVFDRKTYAHIASFTGEPRIANTDGICIFADPFASFERGALFAVNDDQDVRAFDLGQIIDFVARYRRQ